VDTLSVNDHTVNRHTLNGHIPTVNPMIKAARFYPSVGCEIVWLEKGEKTPKGERNLRWPVRTYGPEDYRPGDNIGIKCGARSGNLVCLDIDLPEALAFVHLLPPTGAVEGRKGKPGSHRYYRLTDIPERLSSGNNLAANEARERGRHPGPWTRQFRHAVTNQMILEFKGTGAQVAAPPSVHPSGEVREWEHPYDIPAVLPAEELWEAVLRFVEACGGKRLTEGQMKAHLAVDRVPDAVDKQGGHDTTWRAACTAAKDHGLSPLEAKPILAEYFERRCHPAWTLAEIFHKLHDVYTQVMREAVAAREAEKEPEFKIYNIAECDALPDKDEWAIQNSLVLNQPAVIVGPRKAGKTSLSADLWVSLASGKPFLDGLKVYGKHRTLLVSGESGVPALRSLRRRICKAKGVNEKAFKDETLLSPHLLTLTHPPHLAWFVGKLKEREVKVVIIDPTYRAINPAARDVSPADLFGMGNLYAEVCEAILAAGVTPVFVSHTKTGLTNRKYAPIDLEDLAYAGADAYFRQWLLVNPRQPFDAEVGKHRLHLSTGGSAMHAMYRHLDLTVGIHDGETDRTTWKAETFSVSQVVVAKEQAKAQVVEEDARNIALYVADRDGQKETINQLHEKLHIPRGRVSNAVNALRAAGRAYRDDKPPATVVLTMSEEALSELREGPSVGRRTDGQIDDDP
jgi:hypothetical protein